jgi:hypothetical protein
MEQNEASPSHIPHVIQAEADGTGEHVVSCICTDVRFINATG